VSREQFEHVIEEADSRRYFVLTTALDRKLDSNTCLCGIASQTRGPQRASPGCAIPSVGRSFLRRHWLPLPVRSLASVS